MSPKLRDPKLPAAKANERNCGEVIGKEIGRIGEGFETPNLQNPIDAGTGLWYYTRYSKERNPSRLWDGSDGSIEV